MKRKLSTALVMLLAFVLLIGTTAITASAAETTYEAIGGSTTLLVKNLVVDADANIPDITFSYNIRRDTHKDATGTTIEILEASRAAEIGTAVFSNDDTANTINGLPSDADPTSATAGKKYAQKSIPITFPVGTFTKPGVYRFVITETDNHLPGVTYDSNQTRYLDVFVVANDNNVLSVNGYVLRDSATDISINNGEYVESPGVKSSGYTNILTQYDFDFSKTISGNQGDKNKRFNFTLKITGANPGVYPVITNGVTDNPTSITVGANGTATGEYSLTNGSTVKVVGLNAGAVCTVTENPDDYTATYSLDGGDAVSGADSSDVTLDRDHSVAFTNTRNGIIPTGIIMTIAPFAIGICVFGAVFIFIICRKKRRRY